ncbi:MAG: T9SS type A sorting domain-containing protein [Bacteroidia bacterium]
MKRIIKAVLSLFLISIGFGVYAQQIERDAVSQGGNTIENTNVKLSVTIGETAAEVHNTASVLLSEGLEQHRNLFTLSVMKVENLKLTLYPNPASNKLQVSSDVVVEKVIIMNGMGQDVLTIPMHSKTKTIQVGQLPAGMYFVKINQSNTQFISKFIKI